MEAKEFKQLIKKKEQIESKVAKKDERIDAIRDETRKKIRKLRRQKKDAMDAYDAKIAALKADTKKKLFLLKDKNEFSIMKAEQIDDMIAAEFEGDVDVGAPDTKAPDPEPVVPESSGETGNEIRIAINNFRFNLKNEPSFRKEFKELKKIAKGKLESMDPAIREIESLLSGNSNAKAVREAVLKKLAEIDALMDEK
jgi:hypothetical protein